MNIKKLIHYKTQGWLPFKEEESIEIQLSLISKKNFFNVYSFLRDGDRAQSREGQKEKETQNLKQSPGSKLSAQSLTWGWNPGTVRS